jgi:hypothetical protein
MLPNQAQEKSVSTGRTRRLFADAGLLVRTWRLCGYEFVARYVNCGYGSDSEYPELRVRSIKRDPVREAMALRLGPPKGARSSSCGRDEICRTLAARRTAASVNWLIALYL